MQLKLLAHDQRYRVYGLDANETAATLLRITGNDANFADATVRKCCLLLAEAPIVGEPFKTHGKEIETVICEHYRSLLSDGLTDDMPVRASATAKRLSELGTDLRCFFLVATRVGEAAFEKHQRRVLTNGKRLLSDLSLFQRFLICDAATALTAALGAQMKVDAERSAHLSSELAHFREGVERISGELELASQAVDSAANVVATAASDALTRSRSAANAAEDGNNSLTASATSTEELSNATAELDRRTVSNREALSDAELAVVAAQTAVEALNTAADKIGSIVGLISNIAEQTNLLALNATIEAARAGDAGRGFAVVAQEVKALASQTTRATQDIIAQIGAVQEGTSRSVQEIGAIGKAMDRLSQNASEVTTAVSQQNALTMDLSRNLHETVKQVIAASEGYNAVSTLIENTSSETEELRRAMRQLSALGSGLKSEVDSFAERMKAA